MSAPTLSLLVRNTRNCYTARFEFDRVPVTMGRHPDNRLQLEDPGVSRFHAVLEWVEDELVLCDLGSVNGTFFQGFPLTRCQPRRIGEEKFAFSVGPFYLVAKREQPVVVPFDAATARLSPGQLGRLLRDDDEATLVRKHG